MKSLSLLALLVCAGWASPGNGVAATARELRDQLARGERVTVVDVRGSADFAEAHVPGAINVPADIVTDKRLPPFGRVVVCGDGLRAAETARAVEALSAKPGIRAEPLEGGMGAWEALNVATTREGGLRPSKERYVSYDELRKAAPENPNIVLVDLRKGTPEPTPAAGRAAGRTGAEDDLTRRFGARERVRLGRGPRGELSAEELTARKDPDHRKVYVLIDDGDGEAEKVAHRLKASGVGQVVILAGGEKTIARDGAPGLRTQESGP